MLPDLSALSIPREHDDEKRKRESEGRQPEPVGGAAAAAAAVPVVQGGGEAASPRRPGPGPQHGHGCTNQTTRVLSTWQAAAPTLRQGPRPFLGRSARPLVAQAQGSPEEWSARLAVANETIALGTRFDPGAWDEPSAESTPASRARRWLLLYLNPWLGVPEAREYHAARMVEARVEVARWALAVWSALWPTGRGVVHAGRVRGCVRMPGCTTSTSGATVFGSS